MGSRHRVIQAALAAGLLWAALAACARSPLDSSVSTSPSADNGPLVGGQIGVTLYSGSLPNGTGFVDLIQPDGSKLSQNAAPSCTFTALTQSGTYRLQFRDQNAAKAASTAVVLSPHAPIARVVLQVGGASLQVQAAPFQPTAFPYNPSSFNYYLQVNQAPADAQDLLLDVDPAGLPPGWTYRIDQPVVRGNADTTLVVGSANATTCTAVALKVRGRVGSVERVSQGITLPKGWSVDFSSQGQGCNYVGANNFSQNYTVSPYICGMPPWVQVWLNVSCANCSNWGGALICLPTPWGLPVSVSMTGDRMSDCSNIHAYLSV